MGKPAFAELSSAVAGMEAPDVRVELGGDAVFLNAETRAPGTRASVCLSPSSFCLSRSARWWR